MQRAHFSCGLLAPSHPGSPPCVQQAASFKPFYKMCFSQVSPSKAMVTARSSTSLFLLETQVSSIKNVRLTGKDKMEGLPERETMGFYLRQLRGHILRK